jgi:phage terminase large subunit-like protein
MIQRAPDLFNEEEVNMTVHSRSIMLKGVDKNGLLDVRHFNSLVRTPKDGTNPHFAVIDEYHEHQTDALVSSLRTGMGARAQPLLFEITTAGFDIGSPCFSQRHVVTQVLQGSVTADDFFGIIYTIDDGDDWESLDSWKKANPNYGVSVNEEDVERTLGLARQVQSKQTEAKVKRLNIWGQASNGFIDMRRWLAMGDSKLRLEDFKGRPCYMGFDLSAKSDITSLCMLFPDQDNSEKVTVFWRNWLPQGTVGKVENEHYRRYEQQGWLTVMDGDSIRHTQLQQEFLEYVDLFDVKAFAYDPWGMRELAEWLEEQRPRLPIVEFKQGYVAMTPPLRHLEDLVIRQDMTHEDNPLVNWMAGNLKVTEVGGKGLKADKNKISKNGADKNKIDAIMALTMAIGVWRNDKEQGIDLYDGTRQLVT